MSADRLRAIADAVAKLRRDLKLPLEPASDATLPLATPAFGEEEVAEAVLALLEGKLTMGERTRRFEAAWARYVGVDHAVMVNSGSSANLLALKALQLEHEDRLRAGRREVVTSPVTWSTSIFPIYDAGAVPHFTDVELGGLTQRWADASRAVSERTFALLPVHLMGIPTDIEKWAAEADRLGVPLVEDCCESHGAKRNGKLVGDWGVMSTFSFFFSHHLTTIEGGMVCTDDVKVADTLRSLRAHGWVRERSDALEQAKRHPDIDPRFLFLHHGYNVRPTEVQAAFGIHQIPRLDGEVARRQRIVESWRAFLGRESLPAHLPRATPGDTPSWFGVPLILDDHAPPLEDVRRRLAAAGVESRPIMGGNFAVQPAAKRHGFLQTGPLTNAERVQRRGLYLGIPALHDERNLAAAQDALRKALR